MSRFQMTIIAISALAVACAVSPAQVVVDATPGRADLLAAPSPYPCLPLGCDEVEVGPFKPDEPVLTPDRRPGVTLGTWNGNPDNPLGLSVNWWDPNGVDADPNNGVPDVFDKLLDKLDLVYERGFRRISLRLPAGYSSSTHGSLMSSSQWWTMPQWRRDAFEEHVAEWIDDRRDLVAPDNDISFGIYAGFEVYDPCLLDMHDSRTPDWTSRLDMCIVYQNLTPWIEIGTREFWLDASSSAARRDSFIEIAHSPNYWPAARLGGEALPIDGDADCNNGSILDANAVSWTPWMALWRYVDTRFPINMSVDPASTELCVIFDGHSKTCGPDQGDQYVFNDLREYHERGFVLWAGTAARNNRPMPDDPNLPNLDYLHYRDIEAIQRALGFGVISAGADFDNDGYVNEADMQTFIGRYLAPHGPDECYWHGDMDADDDVDQADWDLFFYMYERWTEDGVIVPLDLDGHILPDCPDGGD